MIQMMKKYSNSNNQINVDDITEYLYQIEVDKDNMIDDIDNYSSLVDLFTQLLYNKTYNPLKILIRFILRKMIPNIDGQLYNLNTIKTKYFMNKLSKDQLIEAYNAIIKYENKQFPAKSYKDYYMKVTGITTCKTCSNPMVRIHEDFQRIILNQIKTICPEVIDYKLIFHSGKYGLANSVYMDTVPFYTFSKIGQLMNQMKAQAAALTKKGYKDLLTDINSDIKALENLLKFRNEPYNAIKQPLATSIPMSDVSVSVEKLSVENEALNESLNEDNLMEFVAEHLSEVLNTEIKVISVSDESEENSLTKLFNEPIELPKFTVPFNVPTTLQEAWELKLAGHKLSVIAQSMGTSHQALSKQFKMNGFTEFND